MSGVDINEVVRRGIRRKKPANEKGEELRDVLLWLLVFQYAKKEDRQVAFISGDAAFRKSKDEDELHPDLKSEIVDSKLPIRFYRHIAAFLTSQSLSQQPIAKDWFSKLVNVAELSKRIAQVITATATRYGWPYDVSNDGPQFVEGTAYQISSDSVYAELKYVGRARLFFERLFNNMLVLNPSLVDVYHLSGETISALAEAFRKPSAIDIANINVQANPATKFETRNPPFRKFDVLFDFEAWLSARVEKETLVSWQVDHVNLIESK